MNTKMKTTETQTEKNRLVKATELMRTLPQLPQLQKWGVGEGETVNPLDLSFKWKVKGADTGFAFGIYEMVIQPGQQVPIHIHPYPEFFYVLEGRIDVMGLDPAGTLTYLPVSAGECANAPSNAPHGTGNRSTAPARFLSVSNYEHQKGFDDYQEILNTPEGKGLTDEQKAAVLMNCFARYGIIFLDAQEQ